MLSDKFFKSFARTTNFLGYFFALPFQFDPKRRLLYTGLHTRRRCIRLFVVCLFVNSFYVGAMQYFHKVKDNNSFNQAYLGWICCSLFGIFFGCGALLTENICHINNTYTAFLKKFQGKVFNLITHLIQHSKH